MNTQRLTQRSQEALQAASSAAVRHGHQETDSEHLLLALLQQEEGLVSRLLGRLEIDAGGTRVVPFDPRLLHEIFLPDKNLLGAKAGEMVVAEITRYPSPYRAPIRN